MIEMPERPNYTSSVSNLPTCPSTIGNSLGDYMCKLFASQMQNVGLELWAFPHDMLLDITAVCNTVVEMYKVDPKKTIKDFGLQGQEHLIKRHIMLTEDDNDIVNAIPWVYDTPWYVFVSSDEIVEAPTSRIAEKKLYDRGFVKHVVMTYNIKTNKPLLTKPVQ